MPHSHLDVGFTDYQAKVAEDQSRTLDEAIQLIHDHPDFCFSPDGFWCVQQFLATRTEEQKQLLYQAVKDKKIFVQMAYASLVTGFPALETLIRSLYPSFEFNKKYGGDANYANITDVPSYSWSYASVMAAAGLKYFAAGSDNYRAPVLLQGRLHEKSPFWWEGPDGGRILMWYSRHYLQMQYFFGLPPQIKGGTRFLAPFPTYFFPPRLQIGRNHHLWHAGGEHGPLSATSDPGGRVEQDLCLSAYEVLGIRRSDRLHCQAIR